MKFSRSSRFPEKLLGVLIWSSFVSLDIAKDGCVGVLRRSALMRFWKGVVGLSSTFRSKKGKRVDEASGSWSEVSLLSAVSYSDSDGARKDWRLLRDVFDSFRWITLVTG